MKANTIVYPVKTLLQDDNANLIVVLTSNVTSVYEYECNLAYLFLALSYWYKSSYVWCTASLIHSSYNTNCFSFLQSFTQRIQSSPSFLHKNIKNYNDQKIAMTCLIEL